VILAPSILAADLAHLADEIAAAQRGGAGIVHVDVMDGHFVPNLTLGPAVVRAVRRSTRLPVDVHLMIEHADLYLDAFVDAGATRVAVHVEGLLHLQRALAHLHKRGVEAGAALNPSTPLGALEEILPEVDYVLLMTVNPGFAGQVFLPSSLDKIHRLRQILSVRSLRAQIQVDGGITPTNIRTIVEAGAEIVVAGAAVFGTGQPEAAARQLIEAAG
jgi:ribulose-phosphate 3-epimerase